MWSNRASVRFEPGLRTAPGIGTEPRGITNAIVEGIGPRVVVESVPDLSLQIRFVHAAEGWPDMFFRNKADADHYHAHAPVPGFVEVPSVNGVATVVLWMLPGSVNRFFRHLDDVLAYSRALGTSSPPSA